MTAPRHELGLRLLQAGAVATAAFGLLVVCTPWPGHLFSFVAFGEWTSWTTETEKGAFVDFAYAVMGATIVGWMSLVWWTVRGPLAAGVPGAWAAVAGSVAVWFVLDSTTSLARGYPGNVAFNVVSALGLFVPGLWLTRPARRPGGGLVAHQHPGQATEAPPPSGKGD